MAESFSQAIAATMIGDYHSVLFNTTNVHWQKVPGFGWFRPSGQQDVPPSLANRPVGHSWAFQLCTVNQLDSVEVLQWKGQMWVDVQQIWGGFDGENGEN